MDRYRPIVEFRPSQVSSKFGRPSMSICLYSLGICYKGVVNTWDGPRWTMAVLIFEVGVTNLVSNLWPCDWLALGPSVHEPTKTVTNRFIKGHSDFDAHSDTPPPPFSFFTTILLFSRLRFLSVILYFPSTLPPTNVGICSSEVLNCCAVFPRCIPSCTTNPSVPYGIVSRRTKDLWRQHLGVSTSLQRDRPPVALAR